ncbi:MAG: nucleotidyltransferase family protein [Candidatus Desantisbacteria bacterium]
MKMKTLEKVKQILRENFEFLTNMYRIRSMGIFGSYVREEQKKESDIDILVEFNEPISLLKLVNIENFLTDFIGIKVDLISKEDIRPELKETILSEVVYI